MPFELISDEAPQEESESLLSQAGRGIARTTSRVAEQAVGLPGDIFSLINEYIARPIAEKVTGGSAPYEETLLGKLLPTTESHKGASERAFGETVKPQNDYEKFIDEVVQDATAIAVPGFGQAKKGKTALKALAISTAANSVGDLAQDLSSDEKTGAYAKLGSLMMLSLLDKPAAAESISRLYKPLQEKASSLASVNAEPLSRNLNILKNKMTKGTIAPSEKFIIDEVDAILPKIQNGKIRPEELWATKRSLNEKLSKILYDIPEKATQQRARKLAKGIQKDLSDTLKETAKQDPKFYKDLKAADKAFAVVAKSNLASRYIENNLKYNPMTAGLLHIFGSGAAKVAGPVLLPYQVGKVFYRISKSPILAKHYAKVVGAAASEDAAILNREMMKLDQGLQKETKKDRFEFID